MLVTYKEIKCDSCGESDTFLGTKKKVEESWERHGGLIIGNKHFCDAGCYKEFCIVDHANVEEKDDRI